VEVEAFDAAARNTTKPLVGAVISDREVRFLHRAFSVIAGSEQRLRERPMFAIGVSPISPLALSEDGCAAMCLAAELAIPTRILPAPMLGGTAPMTFAGALALQNAELLAGLTLMQVAQPGCPVVLAPRLSVMDMRTGYSSYGTPELGMASACATQLAHSYGLPVDAVGLSSDSPTSDEQMGYEKAMNGVVAALAGTNWLSGPGGGGSGKSASLEQLVIDNEIVAMICRLLGVFEVNEDTLALEVIDRVGPRGNFLSQPHTARHLRSEEHYYPALSRRLEWEQWVAEGSRDIVAEARDKAREILRSHQAPPLSEDVTRELDQILEGTRREYEQL
jgi:trimethylamine--corrinoid protein Co-methyltransferase